MSVHTKTSRTNRSASRKLQNPTKHIEDSAPDEGSIPWRELFRDLIEKQTEEGLYLSAMRLREGLTQKQLGDKLGVGQAQISRMERGLRSITKEIAKSFSILLRAPYKNFMKTDHAR